MDRLWELWAGQPFAMESTYSVSAMKALKQTIHLLPVIVDNYNTHLYRVIQL